jgi:hypothetical protein
VNPLASRLGVICTRGAVALEAFDAGNFVYLPTGGGDYRPKNTYGDAVVPIAFIEKHWSPYFDIVEYLDDPRSFWQAVLVVRRK